MSRLHELIASAELKHWIEDTTFTFLILYALFGLREVRRHLPAAWARAVEQFRKRQFRKLAQSGYWVLVALGPLYIALEVLERSI